MRSDKIRVPRVAVGVYYHVEGHMGPYLTCVRAEGAGAANQSKSGKRLNIVAHGHPSSDTTKNATRGRLGAIISPIPAILRSWLEPQQLSAQRSTAWNQ